MSTRYQALGLNSQSRPSLRTLELGTSTIQPRPRFPISPPETERSVPVHTSSVEPRVPMVSTPDEEKEGGGFAFRHLRRAPSVQYNQATINPRPQQPRAPRWLLVVLPPASCLEGDPALGQTLAMGPPGRLQSGVLMPLFPTMYGQLTAIAKEFNFPSTTGVCLYLHVSEPGVNISPRISDDAWQMLWSPYFNTDDNGPASPSGLPICGQIEFDVDMRKAKWYEYWVTGQERRVSLDASIPASVAQTMSRWYQDHREATQETSESLLSDNVTAHLRSKPIPRPLTLSTRGDGLSRSLAKYRLVNPRDMDATESVASKRVPSRLSPVLQVDESDSANQKDLDTLVRQWRATTPMAPAIPRPGPAGESVPDTYDLPLSEVDMDDYQWSASSAGPPSRWPSSTELVLPAHSVGLDRRMLGSVVLTPSIATSFGPDESLTTPTFSNASRFPSPDIAARMIEDSPASPSTATSWGAPLSWPTTPASIARILSPDMAARAFTSLPNTPTTATSWGAPSVWPTTPTSVHRPGTPDIGRRAFGSAPVSPTTATSWGAPEFWPPSPLGESRPPTPDTATRVHDDRVQGSRVYESVWPFFNLKATRPYRFVWPFLSNEVTPIASVANSHSRLTQAEIKPSPSSRGEVSPRALVWPYFTKSLQKPPLEDLHLSAVYPSIIIYEAVYPNLVVYPPYGTDSAENGAVQKHLVEKICPAYDYPNLVIYATTITSTVNEEIPVDTKCQENYGIFNLYPAVYPSVVPYPARYECTPETPKALRLPASSRSLSQSTVLSPLYPFFDLYPALYPSLVIYPLATPITQVTELPPSKLASNVHLTSSYPHFVLYRPAYPHLVIYPSVAAQLQESEHDDRHVAKNFISSEKSDPCSTRLLSHYPFFNLYPACYPALEIYPDCHDALSTKPSASPAKLDDVELPSQYPRPDIYPILSPARAQRQQIQVLAPPKEKEICNIVLPSFYPYLNIYPQVYPFLGIYPPSPLTVIERAIVPRFYYPDIGIYKPKHGKNAPTSQRPFGLPIRLKPSYPSFDLYPAAYPNLEIYPRVANQKLAMESVLLPGAVCRYPNLCIYPEVQQPRAHQKTPTLSICVRLSETPIRSSVGSPRQRTRQGSNQWALNSILSTVPRLRRGSVNASVVSSARKPITRQLKSRKSHSDLIREVFAQVALSELNVREESKASTIRNTPGVSDLRRVASARVDELPPSNLHRSRTIPTSRPPVPSKARFHPSSGSSGGHSTNVKSIGSSADAVAAAMFGMTREGWIAERISRPDEPNTPDTSSIKLSRRVSKLDKSRYPFL